MKILSDYEGRAVRLTDERLEHVLEHPEMHGMESALGRNGAPPDLSDRIQHGLTSPVKLSFLEHALATNGSVLW